MNALQAVADNDIVTLRIIISYANSNNNYNLEEVDYYGNTALLKACYLNRFECVQTLLHFGANVHAINYLGQNALTLATFAGNTSIVRELLRYRSYKDFNESSIIPAICVATIRQKKELIDFFKSLDQQGSDDIETVHGLNSVDLGEMLRCANIKNNHQKMLNY